jgi:beta-glucosidase
MKSISFIFLIIGSICYQSVLCGDQAREEMIDKKVSSLLQEMTLKEKIDYIGGYNSFSIRPIPRLGIAEIRMADGPHGVRNVSSSLSYPASICMASTWDRDLAMRFGEALATDARKQGVHVLLAPGVNIVRSPLCGRGFEYFGEDPFLTSQMSVSVIRGIQKMGVMATVKHFAVYNQEWNRHQVSADVDERALREIYLPAFEACVKEGNVAAVMNAYNCINGIHASQHGFLNNDILKKEWGFRGFVMSDWNGTYDGLQSAQNGLDLEMPEAKFMTRDTLLHAIKDGLLLPETIDDKVARILRKAFEFGCMDSEKAPLSDTSGRKIAQEIAEQGIVLLKNSRAFGHRPLLPLRKPKLRSIAVIGPRAKGPIPQGGGSSQVSPIKTKSLYDGIVEQVGTSDIRVLYARGVPEFQTKMNLFITTTPGGNEEGFRGEYFDHPDLQGSSEVRIDREINFEWKEKSYKPDGPVNHYSIRWTGYCKAGVKANSTFYVRGAGSFRLFVNDKLLIDNWDKKGEALQWKTVQLKKNKSYKICLEYAVGYDGQAVSFGICPGADTSLEEAKKMAAKADCVILCVGFDAKYEGEDWDRPFTLPEAQNTLIQAVAEKNKNTIVVMTAGGNVDMSSWIGKVRALVYAWYPGEEGGRALAKILFGKINPSGKLPVSFEKKLEDNAAYRSYHDTNNSKRVAYTEGIFVGYRHFDTHKIEPLFPFGFGLSYTTFDYSNLNIERKDGQVLVSFDVMNSGTLSGKEIAQVYVRAPHAVIQRPEKELKGFCKVSLEPLEKKSVTISLNDKAFSYYDVDKKSWIIDPGVFEILVGASSRDIKLKGEIDNINRSFYDVSSH